MAKRKACNDVYTGPSSAQERQWRAEDDLRTLQRAAEIQGDSSRVRAAQQIAKKQMAALSKVARPAPRGKR